MDNYTTTSRRISSPGCNTDVWYGPWDSVEQYISESNAKKRTIPLHHTILVKQSDGSYKEMRNDYSQTEFEPIEGNSTTVSLTGDNASYLILPSEWNITEGYINKNQSGHYTSAQYEQMKNNGIGITNAIKYAYAHGYSNITLSKGTYCFCAVDYHPMNWSGSIGLPSINLYDLNNVNIDLNGSKLCLLIDSTEWSPYICEQGKGSKLPYASGHIVTFISYCNHLTIRNGIFEGDRFLRDYEASDSTVPSASGAKGDSWNESTYGIMIGAGNEDLKILDCDFIGFMGDGISGQPTSYYYGSQGSEGTEKVQQPVNFIYSNDQYEGWEAFPENTWSNSNTRKPTQKSSKEDTCITPLYTTSNGQRKALIDVDTLYTSNMVLNNRKKHKESRMFQICATGGYNRTVQCYPNLIGILTYDTIEGTPTPLRYLEVGYMSKFKLTENERYLRLQYTHEDHCATSDNLTAVTNPLFVYKCIKACKGAFDEDNWERQHYNGTGVPTFNAETQYKVGDTVTYYQLLRYRCIEATSGTWDETKWKIQTAGNAGNKVDYVTTRNYTANQFVTQTALSGYIPKEKNNIDIKQLWFPSITPLIGISELHTYGCTVERCKFIDSHRGNMSNMPNETIVRDCYFHKNFHIPGDGSKVPNFSGQIDGVTIQDTTQYSIDLEDYCCSSFKIYNSRFETPDLTTGMILLNAINQVVDGCTGQAGITIYNTNSSSVITNNSFDRTSFNTFQGNNRRNQSSHKYYRSHLVYANNTANISSLSGFDQYGREIEICNNDLQVEMMVSGEYNITIPVDSGATIKHSNNRISTLYKPSVVAINPNVSVNDTLVGTGGTDFRIASPSKFLGTTIENSRVTFVPGIDKINIDGFVSKTNDVQIGIPPLVKNNKYSGYFKNCTFDSYVKGRVCMLKFDWNERNTRSAITVDLYFIGCDFTSSMEGSYNADFLVRDDQATTVSGDTVNFHFINCTFDTNHQSFANNSMFVLSECKNCTFIRNITFNGITMQNK